MRRGSYPLFIAASSLLLSPALARGQEDFDGDLGALASGGVADSKLLVGGGIRAGGYYIWRESKSLVIGNRVGGELRWHQYYSTGNGRGPLGHILIGANPSFAYEFSHLHRRASGFRVPSVLGLVTPESGIWVRTAGVPLLYLTWRSPVMLLEGEAGIECAPAFTWAPAGSWIATLSIGGFLR